MVSGSGVRVGDAAEVGRALTYPGMLRAQLAALALEQAPVRIAVRAGWAGLAQLKLETAVLNGAIAIPRQVDMAGRDRGEAGSFGTDVGGTAAEVFSAKQPSANPETTAAPVYGVDTGKPVDAASALVNAPADDMPRADVAGIKRAPMATWPVAPAAAPDTVSQAAGFAGRDEEVLQTRIMRDLAQGDFPRAVGQSEAETIGDETAERVLATAPERGSIAVIGATSPVSGARTGDDGSRLGIDPSSITPMQGLRADVATALRGRFPVAAQPQAVDRVTVEFGAGPPGIGGTRRSAAATRAGAGDDTVAPGLGSASAPRPPEQQANGMEGGGGGVVMLDGRLVGQWLSERMARDAGRPAAGATFFDPRLAPAWTPAGSL